MTHIYVNASTIETSPVRFLAKHRCLTTFSKLLTPVVPLSTNSIIGTGAKTRK